MDKEVSVLGMEQDRSGHYGTMLLIVATETLGIHQQMYAVVN
jgi:hypothetical protein